MNINFSFLGSTNENQVNIENPIVYRSESLITSLSYAGDMPLIKESTTFSDNQKILLIKINGKVSLGTTNGALKNIHVYSKNAIHLDGIERICYLQPDNENLIVKEYSGNRGAKYSALYKLLVEELVNLGFICNDNKFYINEIDIPKLVDAINKIIKRREEDAYELVPIAEIDTITISQEKYFYNKAYWKNKQLSSVNLNNTDSNREISVEQALKAIIDYSKNCNVIYELNELSEKLVRLNSIITKHIQTLSEIDDLNSSL